MQKCWEPGPSLDDFSRPYSVGAWRIRLWLRLNGPKNKEPGPWLLRVAISCVWERILKGRLKYQRWLEDLTVPVGIYPLKRCSTFWWMSGGRQRERESSPGPHEHPVSHSFPFIASHPYIIRKIHQQHCALLKRLPTSSLNNNDQHI